MRGAYLDAYVPLTSAPLELGGDCARELAELDRLGAQRRLGVEATEIE